MLIGKIMPFWLGNIWSQVGDRVRSDAWFYGAVVGYTSIGLVLLAVLGQLAQTPHRAYIEAGGLFVITMPLVAIAFDLCYVVIRFDNRRMLALKRSFSAKRVAALMAGMAAMAGVTIFLGTFTSIKTALAPIQGGFPYDAFLADIDRFLHFGSAPWRYLLPLGRNETLREIVEFNYGVLWFLSCFGALFFVVTSPRANQVRVHYLLMFMIVWVVCGNMLAGLMLSAGPAFYGDVTGDHARFGELVAFVAQSEGANAAFRSQHYLWLVHQSGLPGIGSGISAFPSVHVALVMMNALFLASYSRLLGAVAFVYVGFVLASSVYLGWHYAIDGYVSIIVVTLAYYLSRRLFGPQASGASAVEMRGQPAAATA